MAHVAIAIEGGLFSADLLERLGSRPEEVPGQRPADFGLDGARLSEEIQATFSDVQRQWQTFEGRSARHQGSATSLTRDLWMLPVLRLLGHDLDYQRAALLAGGGSFTISHVAGDEEGAPPVHIVAHDEKLDERGKARQSPHALVQDYLNRSDCLWGVVTNGKKLRLLRNSKRFTRPTYVEFDLEAMVTGNLYSEFVVLFRLAHCSRLPRGAADAHQSWLEQYYQQGIAEGGRVRERLSDGVFEALRTLGSGFLAHPESTKLRETFLAGRIDEIDYYRQLLRLVYRLLFLMVAEERRLLLMPDHENAARQRIYTEWYSITRLRQLADRRFTGDRYSDLFEGLKQPFLLVRDDSHAAVLGLTALDGELFGGHACRDLEAAACRNEDLLHAVFRLSRFQASPEGRRRRAGAGVWQRVNYAGLDVEELGSVYEDLLEYRPYVDRECWTFDLVKGSQRKETASYYTPHPLVVELIESALVPVMEERLAKATTPEAKERALLDLKVIDPAAGSGHFLLAAARRIGKELARVRTGEPEPAPEAQRAAIRDVVRHCLYAVDRNPLAVDLCKVALWIEGHNTGRPLSFLDHHIKLGDSLIGVFDLKVVEKGVPDGAYKPLTGDDAKVASELRKRNKREAEGQETLGLFGTENLAAAEAVIARAAQELEVFEDDSPAAVHEKGRRYHEFRELHPDFRRLRQACDLWTAAFFAKLEKPAPGAPEGIPTTDHVLRALRDEPGIQGVMKTALELAEEHRFFHWPVEFAEVFARGGFDVVLGNPPWKVLQISRDELPTAQEVDTSKRTIETSINFIRASDRCPLTTIGKLNLYALFAELALRLLAPPGRAGIVVQRGIATDEPNRTFFQNIIKERHLVSLLDFVNSDAVFPIHRSFNFCLLTLGREVDRATFAFFATRPEHLADPRRRFVLSSADIELVNPNTNTCPIFRTLADAELTKKIYGSVPILIAETNGSESSPWYVHVQLNFFSTANAHDRTLFHEPSVFNMEKGDWCAVYRGGMVHQFDHRFATFVPEADGFRDISDADKADTNLAPLSDKYVPRAEVEERLRRKAWTRGWMFGWRDFCRSTDERTLISACIPLAAADDTFSLLLPKIERVQLSGVLLANLNSLILDYIAQQKVGGTHVRKYLLAQLPVLPPSLYTERDLGFIVPKVLELTYTAWDIQPFARDLGYEGEPFRWDPERRALLRAELDAYYAYLYGLSKKELRYILDPKDVMGEDYPSETFRVLKENEIRKYGLDDKGMWRTQRLVLNAYDRFANDGTFDAARLEDPEYFPVVRAALAVSKSREQELERTLEALVARTDREALPALFVEGETDKLIVEGAWRALFPGEPLPVSVLPAGGTMQMRSLAAHGTAMRHLLGDRLVLVVADNDGPGRELAPHKALHGGGEWLEQDNGTRWCLLAPTAEFRAVMERFKIPPPFWPFTIENAFAAALRRAAMVERAYAFSGDLQAELLRDPGIAKRAFQAFKEIDVDDDAYFYLMAPTPEAKDAFAAWATDPARLTPDNFAAFEVVLTGLKSLLARQDQPPDQRRTA
jgi:hypothetical protein